MSPNAGTAAGIAYSCSGLYEGFQVAEAHCFKIHFTRGRYDNHARSRGKGSSTHNPGSNSEIVESSIRACSQKHLVDLHVLDLFEREEADLIRECEQAERAYDGASRENAEERYGDYLDLVESGTELLADVRDHFASTLPEGTDEEYEEAFNRAVLKRLPRFAL